MRPRGAALRAMYLGGAARWADQAEADEALLRSLPRRPGERSGGSQATASAAGALRFSADFRKLEAAAASKGASSGRGGKKKPNLEWSQDMTQACCPSPHVSPAPRAARARARAAPAA